MRNIRVLRKPETINTTGISSTVLYSLSAEGLFPPLVCLGGKRAVGYIEHEVNAVMIARANSYTDDQIKELVIKLIDQRKGWLDELLQGLCA
jgi:prophage regulatory protein